MKLTTTDARVQRAAFNNAVWCEVVCRTHGTPGEFLDGIWINRQETPPFYPNAVTTNASDTSIQRASIQALRQAGMVGEWAVKDSFAVLDLAPDGFRQLFEADWIWREPEQALPDRNRRAGAWRAVRTASELADWEVAWAGDAGEPAFRLFRPALLKDSDVVVFAAYEGERLAAGAIANRTGDVVGLSNLFAPEANAVHFWAGCLGAVMEAFPGLPIVGYEGGTALAHAESVGFETIGALRVWIFAASDGAADRD